MLDFRIAIGVDFGTTFSRFAYAHLSKIDAIVVNDEWSGILGILKNNTALQYDQDYKEVVRWGANALMSMHSTRKIHNNKSLSIPFEYFKLHLGDAPEYQPKLPPGITIDKLITDYLRELGKVMKGVVEHRFFMNDFYNDVLFVFTVPNEANEKFKTIMRRCIYNAGLIKSINTLHLQFITESEAAANHCMNDFSQLDLKTGATHLVVHCGGETVDLTVRKLLSDNRIAETTEHSIDFCGSNYVDYEFLKFLESRVGRSAMNLFKEKHYEQAKYLHNYFCSNIKNRFSGEESKFNTILLDIDEECCSLKKYITGTVRDQLEENEWLIDLDFDTVKSFFDPIINKILSLIETHLSNHSDCSVMFLVGGFSNSKYLQSRIKQKFEKQLKVAIPSFPGTAIVKGACRYKFDIKRKLKWTYGVQVYSIWQEGDPPSRKTADGRIHKFLRMAEKGTEVDDFSMGRIIVHTHQTSKNFDFFYTSLNDASYCDGPEMKKLGSFAVDLSDAHLGLNYTMLLTLHFVSMEATLENENTGKVYRTTFINRE